MEKSANKRVIRATPRRTPRWRVQRQCELCEATYMPQRKWQKFCSQRCRQADYDSRHPRTDAAHRPIQILSTRQSDLFSEPCPSTQGREDGLQGLGLAVATEQAATPLAQLEPLARLLAERAGSHGIIVADVVTVAEQRGIEIPEKAHWLGALMKNAGLKPTDRMRASPIKKHHGRMQRVWVDGN